jgi:hypothetical protein
MAKNAGIKCPVTGFCFSMNKRNLAAMTVMAVWSWLFAWVWHSMVMQESYRATAYLWRSPETMVGWALNGGIVLMAVMAAYIFLKGYEGKGWREGLRFGIIMTLLFAGLGLITYATQPIPGDLVAMWILGDAILYIIGGLLLTKVAART